MTISRRKHRLSTAVACAAMAWPALAGVAAAQSILPGNFLPNPDMETETRFVSHRTEGPTDNSFADYWHHSLYSGWNDLTPPGAPEPVVSGIHSLRLFDQDSYYFAPDDFGIGSFTQQEFRSFATEIPLDAASPTGRAQKLWIRWHWQYDMTAEFDPSVTLNFRFSNDPIIGLDLVNSLGDNKTIRTGSSGGAYEEITVEIDLAALYPDAQTFDMIFLTEGSKDALGVMFVDDVSVSALNPASDADFDGDGDVDGGDVLIWQRGLGLEGQIDNSNGDANGDQLVNGADLTAWQAQFGGPPPLAAVPEPTAWMLLLMGVGIGRGWRRRTHRSRAENKGACDVP